MPDPAPRSDYSKLQKILHWLIAAAIMADLVIAQKFGGLMEDWDRFESRSDHASLGTLVLVLFGIRLVLRIRHGAPKLPLDLPSWQKTLAHTAHAVLYALIGLLLVSGVASAMNADSVVSPFGLFSYGDGNGGLRSFDLFRTVHELATKLIIAVITIHVAAALFHLANKRHRYLTLRMMRFWTRETTL
ncbi:MAG: cytochrome b/b6 domain-containing protein [Pseudomonadota bacterium]